jgi:hypothetical protein
MLTFIIQFCEAYYVPVLQNLSFAKNILTYVMVQLAAIISSHVSELTFM